jgi:hypothetical protein
VPFEEGKREMWIISYGNFVDGHLFVGPFSEVEDATAYAERTLRHEEWWVVKLETPETEGEEEM